MAENLPIDPRDPRERRIAQLEADLARASRLIRRQRKEITQLQKQLARSPNQIVQQQYTPLQKNTSRLPSENSDRPLRQKETQELGTKRALPRKRRGLHISSRVKFARAVILVGLVIMLIGFAIMRRFTPNSSQPTLAPSPSVPTPEISPSSVSPVVPPASLPTPLIPVNIEDLALEYNVKTPANLQRSGQLQVVVDDIVALAANKGLPTQPLSITLIDVNTGEYAEYQQDQPRFPASVIKMFWMVYLYAQIQNSLWNEADFIPYLNEMINNSDNNAASYILDTTTQTQSGQNLEGQEYETWLRKREQVNKFFQTAGYQSININQKTFPINYLSISKPSGSDLKMRGNPQEPIRNQITTQQAARLLYEIYKGQALSPAFSKKMADLLTLDAQTRTLNQGQQNSQGFNPVRGYFSQSLPLDVYFGGKAGWTSGSRQEAAYIATPDGRSAYILAIFGNDRSYSDDWEVFPQISSFVFDRMTNRRSTS